MNTWWFGCSIECVVGVEHSAQLVGANDGPNKLCASKARPLALDCKFQTIRGLFAGNKMALCIIGNVATGQKPA